MVQQYNKDINFNSAKRVIWLWFIYLIPIIFFSYNFIREANNYIPIVSNFGRSQVLAFYAWVFFIDVISLLLLAFIIKKIQQNKLKNWQFILINIIWLLSVSGYFLWLWVVSQ